MKRLIIAGMMPLLFACTNTNEFDPEMDKKVSQPTNTPASNAAASSVNLNPQNSLVQPAPTQQPVITPVPAATANQPVTTTKVATAPGMNPAHGEPGHDCAIPVGAPLKSAPKTTTTTTTAPQNITINPVQPAKKTAAGMNPAHGEPGHRCDIAVGAPLNSAPSTPAKAGSTQTTNAPVIEQWKAIDTTKN